MSAITGLGSTPIPEPPSDGPSATSSTASGGAASATPAAARGGVGGWFGRLFDRVLGRSAVLTRADGDAKPSDGARAVIDKAKGATFATRDDLVAGYKARLGELDTHYKGRRDRGERGGIDGEARRADFELTAVFAEKGKALGLSGGDLDKLVEDLLGAKTGLAGLGVKGSDYQRDLDKDGLSARAELLSVTSDYAIDTDVDGLTDVQELKANLDPTRPRTEVGIESNGWSIEGFVWYPYFDDKPVLAFSKYDEVFGANTAREFEPFFEGYAAGGQGNKGTWLPAAAGGRPGHVKESDFARTSGVNPVDEPLIPTDAVRLLRQSGAPQDARFALRDRDGKAIVPEAGDRVRPTYVEGGQVKLAEARSVAGKAAYFEPGTDREVRSAVAYRLVGQDGAPRGGADARVEARNDLLGLKPNLKFDFLDRGGQTVDFDPQAGDKVVPAFKDGDRWVALAAKKDAGGAVTGYDKLTYDAQGARVEKREALSADAGKALLDGHSADAMYRVMSAGGGLRGDGAVSDYFDAYWWGKCHNTAKIDQSNLKQPERTVQVAKGVEPGETLAARFADGGRDHVLKPVRDAEGTVTGFAHLVDGRETERLTAEAAAALAQSKGAKAAIVGTDGKVRNAEIASVSPEEVQTLVAHMGQGATEYKGAVGSRFYGTPDRVELKDGRTLDNVRILDAKLASGKSVPVQEQQGGEWKDLQRGLFRGKDIENGRETRGYRQVAFSESSMGSINQGRDDKIESLTVRHPDGRTETVKASDVAKVGRENAYDLSPQDIWAASKMIADGKSFTLEKATGPQVWNYAVKEMATERVDRSKVPASALPADDMPGALAGTTDKQGRLYFQTTITYVENGEPNEKPYFYWVKMDKDGKVTDYNYLVDPTDTEATFAAAPDFFWQTHVKDPVTDRWAGEAEVAGASMSDIQGLYNASVGHMDHLAVLGVFTPEDLAEGRPRK